MPTPSLLSLLTLAPTDPRRRLLWRFPGERVQDERPGAERILKRGEWEERPSPLPDRQRATRTGQVRATSRRADPSPNAPQLIRLVQHPFVLDTVRARRDPSRARPVRLQVREQERPKVALILRDALQEGRRLPFPSPTEGRERVLRAPLPRVKDWLLSVRRPADDDEGVAPG